MVYDHRTQQLLGVIADASTGGFLLRGCAVTDIDSLYHLDVRLPEEILNTTTIEFTAICRWSITKEQGKQHHAGFQIVGIAEQNSLIWQKIIEDYAFSAYEIDK